ncbi:Uma2 family endonuclease [Actinocorallia sp. B10E7]|uniref:Uma2 family endonuclease n=1 Tax=Actinocorallia sp. B10E7 TaxID=3153558 RepID=UPI00325E20AA
MGKAFDWSFLNVRPPVVDMAVYSEMPEDLSRLIEIKDGLIFYCESLSPNHIAISRTIEMALRNGVAKQEGRGPCLKASGDLDMLVSEVPFSFRRPDAIVYRCVEEPRGRWKTKPTAADALLVVEVVSPGTITADLRDKRTEYAALGIPHYWIVRMAQDDGPAVSVERLRLMSDGAYVTDGIGLRSHGPAVDVVDPVEVLITWEDLDQGLD